MRVHGVGAVRVTSALGRVETRDLVFVYDRKVREGLNGAEVETLAGRETDLYHVEQD